MKKLLSLTLAVVMAIGAALSSGYASINANAAEDLMESVIGSDALRTMADSERTGDPDVLGAAKERMEVLRSALGPDTPSTPIESCIDQALESASIPLMASVAGSNAAMNYSVLADYITDHAEETIDDYPAIVHPGVDEDTGYMWFFAVSNRGDCIRFEFFLGSSNPTFVGITTSFDLRAITRNLAISSYLIYYYNGEPVSDAGTNSVNIDRNEHYRGKQYNLRPTGSFFTAEEFRLAFDLTFNLICDYYDVALFDMNVYGLSALGFSKYDGYGPKVCDALDDHLGTRIKTDEYPATCTSDGYTGNVRCSYCGSVYERGTVIPKTGEHSFVGDCDPNCDGCGLYRDVTAEHTYDSEFDSKCNTCGFVREVAEKLTAKKPNPPLLMKKSYSTVALAPRDGYEYSLDGETWQDSNIFEGLSLDTEYTFYQRIAETEDTYASETSTALTVRILPKSSCSVVPVQPIVNDYNSITISLVHLEGYEYSLDGTSWQLSPNFILLEPNTSYTVYQRVRETAYELASEATSVTVKTTVAGVTTADNFDRIAEYVILSANDEDVDGYPSTVDYFEGSGTYFWVYSITNRGSFLRFEVFCGNTKSTHVGSITSFDLHRNSKILNIYSLMFYMYEDEIADAVEVSGSIDRSTHEVDDLYNTNPSGTYITAEDFRDNFNLMFTDLCAFYDRILYDLGTGGLEGVGFLAYEGLGAKVCDPATGYHSGKHVERTARPAGCVVDGKNAAVYCSHCDIKISSGGTLRCKGAHTYDNDCDTDCNVCAEQRITEHQYSSECDDTCNSCSFVREVNTAHVYDSEYDMECNCCGYTVSGDINGAPYNSLLYFIDGGEVKIVGCTDTATSVIIPEKIAGYPVTGIGAKAFNDCTALESLTIPASIVYIEEGAFDDCNKIENVYFGGTEEQWNALENKPEYTNVTFNYVPPYVPGELDGVEGVTDADAVYLLMYTFFAEAYPIDQPCDFTGDGAVTDADAVYLLMHTFFPEAYPIA